MTHKEFVTKIDKVLTPQLDGRLTGREKMTAVAAIGNEHLVGSALQYNPEITQNPEVTEADYQKFLNFFIDVHPPNKETYWLHGHESTVAEFTARLGEKYGLNPWKMRTLALMHDFGRIFSHEADVHEKMGDYVLNEMKIRPDLTGSLHSVEDSIDAVDQSEKLDKPIEDIVRYQVDQAPLEKLILTIADMAGKRDKDTWGIMTFADSLQRHINAGNSFKKAPKANSRLDYRHYDADTSRYLMIIEKLKREKNIDVEEVRQEILQSEKVMPVQRIITDGADPIAGIAVDVVKGRYPVKTDILTADTIKSMQTDLNDPTAGYIIAMAQGHKPPTSILFIGNTPGKLAESGIKTLPVNDTTTYADITAGLTANGLPLEPMTHV